ncbi:GNAT family N-acetyltransferase [Reinekea marina]|uniref:GNAT family N-acetyltransferase n=1 Tax=Reinekea marina TaxID=1310421 RepID=A0ABV7WR39_9GAMM|nr:GNAT family N-acetyltransferase [Reinekea marina]MDN3647796.1 GNAT family N-acetyltransferase [Reinekea marina]
MNIEFSLSPAEDDIELLLDGLRSFNAPIFPNRKTDSFGLFVRNDEGKVVGGLSGEITFTSIFIKYLWLSESLRGCGIGERLIKQLEQEAVKLGVANLCVDTYTFQAPKFYEKNGFKQVGCFKDFPLEGVDRLFYQKKLTVS